MSIQVVIFTDLDGTLLNHQNYNYDAAQPCLDYLAKHNIPLIYTSSKTAVEIERLCEQTNFYHPFIAENGGLLGIPINYFSTNQATQNRYTKKVVGKSRSAINKILNDLKRSFKFKRFIDMDDSEIIALTGLSKQHVQYANQRDCSEPLVWLDKEQQLIKFEYQLTQHQLSIIRGGRFQHVMGKHDKATAMSLLIDEFANFYANKVVSIALGDSPNDLKMLENANYGIVIPNPHAPKMCIDNHDTLILAEYPSPQGWNDALLLLLKELAE